MLQSDILDHVVGQFHISTNARVTEDGALARTSIADMNDCQSVEERFHNVRWFGTDPSGVYASTIGILSVACSTPNWTVSP